MTLTLNAELQKALVQATTYWEHAHIMDDESTVTEMDNRIRFLAQQLARLESQPA